MPRGQGTPGWRDQRMMEREVSVQKAKGSKPLKKDKAAWANFKAFAIGQRNQYIYWVKDAKREETRKVRIASVVERARKNIKPGMPFTSK